MTCRNLPALFGAGLSVLFCVAASTGLRAAEALAAVAANFSEPAERLEAIFESETGHELTLATGSTGKLYAQIAQGAPFDLLLAADAIRPARLEADGPGIAGTRFTYALGRLSLWSADPERIGADGLATLREGDFAHLAIANPELAPYGLAAKQALMHFGSWKMLAPKLVRGENIGQVFAMVATGNAELGLVAKSYVISPRNRGRGSRWDVPTSAHDPIRQQAVLLRPGVSNPAARDFLAFLRSHEAQEVILSFGYGVERAR